MAFDKNDPADVAAVQAMIDEAVAGLKTKNAELLGQLKKARAGDAIDPAELQRLETERDTIAAELAQLKKDHKTVTSERDTLRKSLETEQAELSRVLVSNELTAQLTAAGVSGAVNLKAATAILRQEAGLTVKAAEDGKRVVLAGDKPLADFVKAWAQGDEGKTFVTAAPNSGSGATGSKPGAAPTTAGNLTGTKAERLAAIAAQFPELAQ